MSIPSFQAFMLPVLRSCAHRHARVADLALDMANHFKLSPEMVMERLSNGRQTVLVNRVSWAVVYLTKAGLLDRVRRGLYSASEAGLQVLKSAPVQIDVQFLSQFDSFNDFAGTKATARLPSGTTLAMSDAGTPEERIDAAFAELNAALRSELLERILTISPTAFERLIVDLMLAMGYGAGGNGQHLGRTNDGGVDGVINEDVLGLDVIYLQAKRYAPGNSIGVEKIREFAGVLDERGATKGVLVTTSHFAPPALGYAQRSPKRLVLIDGSELTRLLVRHGVGTRVQRSMEVRTFDSGYFDDLSS